LDQDCQAITDITSGIDGLWFSRSNYTLANGNPNYGANVVLQDLLLAAAAHDLLEHHFIQIIADIKSNVTASKNYMNYLASATANDTALYNSVGVNAMNNDLFLLNNAADTLLSNNNCGGLGNTYNEFKTAWCDVITTSFSFLSLAFFFIAISAIPLLILSRKLAVRLPYQGKSMELDNLENADSHY